MTRLYRVVTTVGIATAVCCHLRRLEAQTESHKNAKTPQDSRDVDLRRAESRETRQFGEKMSPATSARLSALVKPSNDVEDEARLHFEAGRVKEAESRCREAIRLSARADGKIWNTSALQLMGEILIRQGRNREAVPYLLEVFNFANPLEAHLDLTIAYCRLGQYRNALHHYSDEHLLSYMETIPNVANNMPGTRSLRSLEASALLSRAAKEASQGPKGSMAVYLSDAERLTPENPVLRQLIDSYLRDFRLTESDLARCVRLASWRGSYLATEANERLGAIARRKQLPTTDPLRREGPR